MPQTSNLSARELDEFRELLLEHRRQLEEGLEGLSEEVADENRAGSASGLSNMPTHPADMGTDAFQRELALSLQARQRRRIAEIDEAMARVEDGTYGICQATGEAISKERLRAKPWARYSLDYERQIERTRRR
jgi:RNA polymerase-binding protein DksA